MRPDKKFAKKIKLRLAEKQDDLLRVAAVFGDGSGNVTVANQPNFNYVTIGNNVSVIFNNRVPAQAGVKIWAGYASEDQTNINGKKSPKRFQVLSTRSETPSGGDTQIGGFAPAIRYEKFATGGGQDPLNVQLRQFMPLSLNVKSGMTVDLYRGFIWNLSEYLAVARQDIDLTAHIPTTTGKAALVLITIDAAGDVVETKGYEVDIAALTLSDLPAVPMGTMFVSGAVRVYYGQIAVQDARSNTDIVDLRFAVGGYEATPPPVTDAENDFQVGDGAGGWIKKTLAQTVTILQTLLDGVYLKLSSMSAANAALLVGGGATTLHAHAGAVTAETNANNIYQTYNVPPSIWTGLFVATGSSGVTIKYSTSTGNAEAMTPAATTLLAKMRLYNTTRGNSVLIANHVAGTITSVANYPADWINGDVLTIASQTCVGSFGWVDLEITSGLTGRAAVFVSTNAADSTTAGIGLRLHPLDTFSAAKQGGVVLTQATNTTNFGFGLVKLTGNIFCASWNNTGAASFTCTIREAGYL